MIRPAWLAVWSFAALAPAAVAGVALLSNGSLLDGTVETSPDGTTVHQPDGAIQLRPDEVLFVGQSPTDAYEWLRGERLTDGIDSHLALADWAMENRLWAEAARELLDARQLDPRSRRLAVLERRLDEFTRPTAQARVGPVPAAAVPLHSAVKSTPSEPPLPQLPPGALEHFTRRVQPMLRNGCATAGCHRGGVGDPFSLDPTWLKGHADARTTENNLRAAIAAIDLGSPAASPLLDAARGPHHGATPFVGPRRDELLARLEAWVVTVASANAESLPAPTGEPPTEPVPAANLAADPIDDPAVEPASYLAPIRVQRGVGLRRIEPRDEFDPAIFNERFRRPEDGLPVSGPSGPTR